MKLKSLRSPEKWERRIAITGKRFAGRFRRACDSKPVFVLGNQRSGTSMLMYAFHRHPQILVFDEARSSEAFEQFRIRSLRTVRDLVYRARYPIVCLKPICDSHRIGEVHAAFPAAHFIWVYRDYRDVANSFLRKFESATRAIRLVCTGRPGGGWFQEGVSSPVAEVLRNVYRPTLSDFDLACLIWWARNQIIIDSGLIGEPNVTVLKYEALVSQPSMFLTWQFERIGSEYRERTARNITPRSIGRHSAPEMDGRVQDICEASLATLDHAFRAGNPPDS